MRTLHWLFGPVEVYPEECFLQEDCLSLCLSCRSYFHRLKSIRAVGRRAKQGKPVWSAGFLSRYAPRTPPTMGLPVDVLSEKRETQV